LTWKNHPFVEFVKIVIDDFLSVAIVWVLLYFFERLTERMPVPGFAGRLIQAIHQAGSVALVLILVFWLLVDVVQSRGNRK
jgi:SNF family Na+-dependent transporter